MLAQSLLGLLNRFIHLLDLDRDTILLSWVARFYIPHVSLIVIRLKLALLPSRLWLAMAASNLANLRASWTVVFVAVDHIPELRATDRGPRLLVRLVHGASDCVGLLGAQVCRLE